MKETPFKRELKREIRRIFPGCLILENDPNNTQGIPDIIVLWKTCWAALECKRFKSATRRPNQAYYVDLMKKMSFAAFVYPENKDQVLSDLQQSFKPGRAARLPRAQ